MKKLLLAVILLTSLVANAQYQSTGPNNKPKELYTHVVIYRTWEGHMQQSGDLTSVDYGWVTKVQEFHSLKETMGWLSYKENWVGNTSRMIVRLTENELIAIYDLSTAKEIKVKLKTEEKSLPKRVEIQSEKWTEQKYEIQN